MNTSTTKANTELNEISSMIRTLNSSLEDRKNQLENKIGRLNSLLDTNKDKIMEQENTIKSLQKQLLDAKLTGETPENESVLRDRLEMANRELADKVAEMATMKDRLEQLERNYGNITENNLEQMTNIKNLLSTSIRNVDANSDTIALQLDELYNKLGGVSDLYEEATDEEGTEIVGDNASELAAELEEELEQTMEQADNKETGEEEGSVFEDEEEAGEEEGDEFEDEAEAGEEEGDEFEDEETDKPSGVATKPIEVPEIEDASDEEEGDELDDEDEEDEFEEETTPRPSMVARI